MAGLLRKNQNTQPFRAGGTIPNYRIVIQGATDDAVILATAATQNLFGVSYLPISDIDPLPVGTTGQTTEATTGDLVDVVAGGTPDVEYGGTVARGVPVTSDTVGRAVAATEGDVVLGFAGSDAVLGDIAPMLIDRTNVIPGD